MSLPSLSEVKHIVLVLSGKGGVGKSTVSTQLALSLVLQGYKVGIMDIDLCGPSIPRLLGVETKPVHQASTGWVPVYVDKEQRLCCMSIGFLLPNKDTAVVWRGPKKISMIQQFIRDVQWGDLDYLLIDTPPGTSDEHISAVEYLKEAKPDGAVLVTTPQDVSCADVRKELNFCLKVELPILGLIENMSGFKCPHCADCTNIFSSGGGKILADQFKVPFLGAVPIDPNLIELFESNTDPSNNQILEKYNECSIYPTFKPIVEQLVSLTNQK